MTPKRLDEIEGYARTDQKISLTRTTRISSDELLELVTLSKRSLFLEKVADQMKRTGNFRVEHRADGTVASSHQVCSCCSEEIVQYLEESNEVLS